MMANQVSVAAIVVSILCIAIGLSVSQEGAFFPHAPHIRATLDEPESHFAEEFLRKGIDISDTVTDGVHGIKDTVEEKASSLKHKVAGTAERAKEFAEEGAHKLGDTGRMVKDKINKGLHDTKETIKEGVHKVKEALRPTPISKTIPVKHVLKEKKLHLSERIAKIKDSFIDWLRYFFTGKQTHTAAVREEVLFTDVFPSYVGDTETIGETIIEKGKEAWKDLKGVEEVGKEFLSKAKESAKEKLGEIRGKIDTAKEFIEEKAEETKDAIAEKLKFGTQYPAAEGALEEDYVISYEYRYRRLKPTESRRYITAAH